MLRKLLLIFIISLTVACVQKVNLVDSLGRPAPNPSYTSNDLTGSQLNAMFYFVKYEKKKDIDGSVSLIPVYLEWRKKHTFKKNDEVEMHIDMYNPKEMEYWIYARLAIDQRVGQFKDSAVVINRNGYSKAEYRQYRFVIPTNTKAEQVVHIVDVANSDGIQIFHIGTFKYSIED